MPVPRSEIAERSSCNDFACSLVHVQYASVLDQPGRLCVCSWKRSGPGACASE